MDFLDDEFFNQGAFLTDADQESVLLAKGGKTEEVVEFEHSTADIFYLKDFYTDKYLRYTPNKTLRVSLADLRALNFSNSSKHYLPTRNDDDLYQKDFDLLKTRFNEKLQKVVLISREDYSFDDSVSERKHFFSRAVQFDKGLPYGFWTKDFGIIGATPEILFSLKDNKLETLALAGTAKLGQEEELLNSKKDRIEHDLVVTDIKEKMKAVAESMEISETKISEFKNLIHLKTKIKATLKPNLKLSSLVSRLSPTAALGGYPTAAALDFLKHSMIGEKYPNRYFGSAFGRTGKANSLFIVMIRNIEWSQNSLSIKSGGGVVNSSVLQKELEEIKLKREVIRNHYL